MKYFSTLLLLIVLVSCKENTKDNPIPVEPDNGIGNGATPPPVFSFSENIEEAHNKPAFMNQKAVSFDIALSFGGQTRLEGTVSMTTNSTGVRLDKEDGSSAVYDGEQVYLSPVSALPNGIRFDIFTWQYFFALPFKLTDPGTIWDETDKRKLDSLEYETSKLSFMEDIGDSPDDWYVIYKDPETNRLKAAAYIVTYSKDQSEAEEDPHAIVYSDYEVIDNVPFSRKWTFHGWHPEKGLGDKLGEAKISNIKFFDPSDDFFNKPKDSKIVKKQS